MAKTKNERLIERLRLMGLVIPVDAEIERTYAGREQKAAGAFVWIIEVNPGVGMVNHIITSQWPVTDLLKEKKLSIHLDDSGQFTIYPERR